MMGSSFFSYDLPESLWTTILFLLTSHMLQRSCSLKIKKGLRRGDAGGGVGCERHFLDAPLGRFIPTCVSVTLHLELTMHSCIPHL